MSKKIKLNQFLSHLKYFSLQSSALLLSFLSIDRYFTITATPGSWIKKLPFGSNKTATIWSTSIVIFTILLNSFILFFDRKPYKSTGIDCYVLSNGFSLNDVWQIVHLFIYTVIPFTLMLISNTLLIIKTFQLKSSSNSANKYQHGGKQKSKSNRLTFSLLYLTFSFIVMNLPGVFSYLSFVKTFFSSTKTLTNILIIMDYLAYLNHANLFFDCLLVNIIFRKVIFENFKKLFKF
jgi:hypothetical protein